jgi:hypothetical protein
MFTVQAPVELAAVKVEMKKSIRGGFAHGFSNAA